MIEVITLPTCFLKFNEGSKRPGFTSAGDGGYK